MINNPTYLVYGHISLLFDCCSIEQNLQKTKNYLYVGQNGQRMLIFTAARCTSSSNLTTWFSHRWYCEALHLCQVNVNAQQSDNLVLSQMVH
jgi:hypothetical protein